MNARGDYPQALRVLVAAGCVYELCALWSRLPTVSKLVQDMVLHRRNRFAAWWLLGFVVAHLTGVDKRD